MAKRFLAAADLRMDFRCKIIPRTCENGFCSYLNPDRITTVGWGHIEHLSMVLMLLVRVGIYLVAMRMRLLQVRVPSSHTRWTSW